MIRQNIPRFFAVGSEIMMATMDTVIYCRWSKSNRILSR